MPRFRLVWTRTFLRTLRKFLRRHADLEGIVADVLQQLQDDPHAPRLKLHALKGKHRNIQAVSLTYSYRIVLILRFTESEIILLDIGSHDEVYHT